MKQRTGLDDLLTAFAFVSGVVFLTDLALRAKVAQAAKKRDDATAAALARIEKKLGK
jgi:hypothetical protein